MNTYYSNKKPLPLEGVSFSLFALVFIKYTNYFKIIPTNFIYLLLMLIILQFICKITVIGGIHIMDKLINISSNAKFIFNNDDVIIINRTNRKWLKFPKQCYDIIMGYNQKHTYKKLLDDLCDDDDREYMSKLFKALKSMELLTPSKRELNDVSFAISNRCNLTCKHCMVNADCSNANEKFTTKEIKLSLDKIIKAHPKNITITGGEPLLRKDFIEIITYLRTHYQGKIGLMTNATLFTEQIADAVLQSVDTISISLDGSTPETVALIRGKGVFERVLSNIKLLQEKGVQNISISMVITADNESCIDEFFDLCKSLNCKPLLRALNISGNAMKNRSLLTTKQIYTESSKEKSQNSNEQESILHQFYSCSCDAGTTTLTIESDGRIYPCNLFVEPKYCLGNILEVVDLNSLLQHDPCKFVSEKLQEFEPDQINECKDCKVSYFCWSCLHEVLELRNTGQLKTKCKYTKELYQKIWD